MAVITISRQTGSGAAEIGQRLAEEMGAVFLNRQVIVEVAQRLGLTEQESAGYDERTENFISRVARALAYLSSDVSAPVAIDLERREKDHLEMTRKVIREAAATGNAVIFGRGANLILAGHPNVLSVRCIAPLSYRVERVMKMRNVNREEAERLIREEDKRRSDYIMRNYQVDWRDPANFHMLLNSALLGQDACVRLILEAALSITK